MQHTHDVIIIGAGIAGSAMALALAKQGLRVALIDKQQPSPISAEMNLRVSNINLVSEQFLNTLGVIFPENRRGIFKHIKIFQENSAQVLDFSASLLGQPYLGSIIENNVLVNLMQDILQKQSHVNCYFAATAEKFVINNTSAAVHLSQIGVLSASLLIGAEGAHSTLREHCGIIQAEKNYGQTALVAHIATQHSHKEMAYQRFLSSGPLAYLPLHNKHHCSIVWSSTPSHIDYLFGLSDEAFALEVANNMLHALGSVEINSKRACYPLVMRHAAHYISERVALIGDTIHTLHPLAGQGANLGLMDVACLAQCIKDTKEKSRDIGDYAQLRSYERKRRMFNTVMLQAVQLLAKNQQPFSGLRAFGMNCLLHSQFLKRIMIQFAQGAYYDR
jgi:2-octaprenylphenol hydroxylase